MTNTVSKYKIQFPGWDKKIEPTDTAILWVSLRKGETMESKLSAIGSWIDKNYASWIIDIADTLDRHNLRALYEMPEEEAERQAEQEGKNWYEQQADILSTFGHLKDVKSFNFWRSHEQFTPLVGQLYKLAADNVTYREALESDVNAYVRRKHAPNIGDHVLKRLQKFGRLYIMEETAAAVIAANTYAAHRFYPGEQLSSLALLRQGAIDGRTSGLWKEKYVEYRLKSKAPHHKTNTQPPPFTTAPTPVRKTDQDTAAASPGSLPCCIYAAC